MKKILISMKPFLIFQAIIILAFSLLFIFEGQTDLSEFVLYLLFIPYYQGGIYIANLCFGMWVQHRSNNGMLHLLLVSAIALVLIFVPNMMSNLEVQSKNIFEYAFSYTWKGILCFIGGQLLIFIGYLIKSKKEV